ncbi:MAG TPA: CdaR family protein [bacterium]|nr:CdaR family protein [bacterium]
MTRNWQLKLVSLALAVGLWFYAIGEESVEVTRTVPLTIKLKNEKMSVLTTSVSHIQVTLAAPRALLSDLTSEQIQAEHEIGNEVKTAGEYSFRLEAREIKLPVPQIRVTDIMPEVVGVTLDELIVQKVKIQPNFVGEPAFGYKVRESEIQLDPNATLVEGPKGQLEKMEALKTEPIDLVGRVRPLRRTVGLILPPNIKALSETLVDIYIPIVEEFDEKKFENIPVKILKSSQRDLKIELIPAAISFVLKGSRRQLENFTADKILAYVDISSLDPGQHDVPVQLVLPENVSLKDNTPLTIRAVLKK